jgi:hypothetical protein
VQFYDAEKNRIKEHAGKVEVPDPDGVFPRNSKGRESEGWTLSLGGELAGRNLSETQPWALPASKVICRTLLPTCARRLCASQAKVIRTSRPCAVCRPLCGTTCGTAGRLGRNDLGKNDEANHNETSAGGADPSAEPFAGAPS